MIVGSGICAVDWPANRSFQFARVSEGFPFFQRDSDTKRSDEDPPSMAMASVMVGNVSRKH